MTANWCLHCQALKKDFYFLLNQDDFDLLRLYGLMFLLFQGGFKTCL